MKALGRSTPFASLLAVRSLCYLFGQTVLLVATLLRGLRLSSFALAVAGAGTLPDVVRFGTQRPT